METRENQRIVLTKRMLLEALLSMLETKQIHEVSVTELCSTAGINRTTFYKHYGTPDDILKELGRKCALQMIAIQEQGRGKKTMEQLFEDSCMYMYENRRIMKLLISNNRDDEMASQALEQLSRQAALSRMRDQGEYDEADRRLLITYIANGCFSLLRLWLMEDLKKTPQEISELLYRMATRGWIYG